MSRFGEMLNLAPDSNYLNEQLLFETATIDKEIISMEAVNEYVSQVPVTEMDIGKALSDAWEWVKEKFSKFVDWCVKQFTKLRNYVKQKWAEFTKKKQEKAKEKKSKAGAGATGNEKATDASNAQSNSSTADSSGPAVEPEVLDKVDSYTVRDAQIDTKITVPDLMVVDNETMSTLNKLSSYLRQFLEGIGTIIKTGRISPLLEKVNFEDIKSECVAVFSRIESYTFTSVTVDSYFNAVNISIKKCYEMSRSIKRYNFNAVNVNKVPTENLRDAKSFQQKVVANIISPIEKMCGNNLKSVQKVAIALNNVTKYAIDNTINRYENDKKEPPMKSANKPPDYEER